MNFTAQHIRQALIQIAENKGRPHYTLEVVRSVIEAFRAGVHHPLKSAVMSEQIMLPAVKGSLDPRQDELKEFCARAGINRILANISGLHITTICSYLNGNRPLTDDAWTKLSRSFKKADQAYLEKKQAAAKKGSYKKDTCGTINKYRCGCRCGACKAAHAHNKSLSGGDALNAQAKRLKEITAKYCGAMA